MVAYTPELAASIPARLAEGEGLSRICRDSDMPAQRTVYRWIADIDGFREEYEAACEQRADMLAEEMLALRETAEDPQMLRAHLDVVKWFNGATAPKRWSAPNKVEVSGELNLTSGIADRLGAARQRLAAIDAAPIVETPLLKS
jgi:hypothetical protein